LSLRRVRAQEPIRVLISGFCGSQSVIRRPLVMSRSAIDVLDTLALERRMRKEIWDADGGEGKA
jgi:hypothetical protein